MLRVGLIFVLVTELLAAAWWFWPREIQTSVETRVPFTVTGLAIVGGEMWAADAGLPLQEGGPFRPAVRRPWSGPIFLPFDSSAQGLVEADGRLLVALPQSNVIADARTGKVVLRVNGGPNGLAFDRAGKRLFITLPASRETVVLSYPDGRSLARWKHDLYLDHLLWDDGRLLATSDNPEDRKSGIIVEIDPDDGEIRSRWDVPAARAPEGMVRIRGRLLLANDGSVYGVGKNEILAANF